jgi:LMBR1 domain-containing protein 1
LLLDGERALTFALGLLITIGTLVYIIYTATGLALLPVALIKSAPSISAPSLAENTASQLEQNRERQHQLEARNEGRDGGLDSRDRRELESLVREERTLVRRERLAAETRGEGASWLMRAWLKVEAVFRPLKLVGGFLLIIIVLLIWTSMLITGIDKAKNSICKVKCGYLLGHVNIFQPINWIFVVSAKVFPIDYVIFLLLILLLFTSSVVGIATVGIRFLWITIFKIRKGKTSPQALLLATVLLTLIVLAINYSVAMMVAPQYATWGPQTYCDRPAKHPGEQPDCANHRNAIRHCSELASNPVAKDVCTPSVVSTFINRVTVNFPFFGVVDFWAQFAFLGVYLIVFITTLFRTPHFDGEQLDADLEEEEEEGLLASTGRRFNATWQDITGRAKKRQQQYGATDTNGSHEADDE